jgi:hypothetical protein
LQQIPAGRHLRYNLFSLILVRTHEVGWSQMLNHSPDWSQENADVYQEGKSGFTWSGYLTYGSFWAFVCVVVGQAQGPNGCGRDTNRWSRESAWTQHACCGQVFSASVGSSKLWRNNGLDTSRYQGFHHISCVQRDVRELSRGTTTEKCSF